VLGLSALLGAALAQDTRANAAHLVLIPSAPAPQLRPGTLALALHALIQRRLDTSIFERPAPHEATGGSAYAPQIWLKEGCFASSRGILSARQSAHAGREHLTLRALAGGMGPDHRTMAAWIASMNAEMPSLVRAMLLLWAEPERWGGTHVSCDGLTLSANASQAGRGTCAA
jgi:hypothetical protein